MTVVRQPQAKPSLTLHCVAFTRMAFIPLPVPPSIPNDLLLPSPTDFVLFQARLVITTLPFPKPLVVPYILVLTLYTANQLSFCVAWTLNPSLLLQLSRSAVLCP